MKENKFLKLIKTLDKQERKAFHKYLHGLYGKQEKMLRLFNYFHDSIKKDKKVELLNEDFLQNQLFDKKQSGKVIGNLFADLYKYLAEFLRWQKINADADNYEKDKLQIAIFKERGLDDWFYTKVEKVKSNVKKCPLDIWHYLKLMELNHIAYFKISTNKLETNAIYLKNALYALDNFFISAKLNYECELRNKAQNLAFQAVENWLLETILEEYPEKVEANDYGLVYKHIRDLLKNENDEHYQKIKAIFINKRSSYSKVNQLIILIILQNYLIRKIRSNSLPYPQEILDLYKIGLTEKILFFDNEIGSTTFFNILNIACRVGEIGWAEIFCNDYAIFLNKSHQIEAFKLAKGMIAFEKGAYNQVLIHFRDLTFKNVFYSTKARAFILKSLIELDEDKSLIAAECLSFNQFLRRNQILSEHILIAFTNFVSIIKMMHINKNTTKTQLHSFLKTNQLLVYRQWIETKINQYKNPLP